MASDAENFCGEARAEKQFYERQNVLTESDAALIKAIVESVLHAREASHAESDCRFATIKPADLEEAVKFYRKINEALDDSKSVVRRTIITLIIVSVSGLLGLGVMANIKKTVGM